MPNKKSYLQKRIESFGHAFAGVAIFFKETAHAKVHASASILVLIFGFIFKVSTFEWLLLIICISLVLVAEALNSAIEYVVDLASPNFHNLAKKAKDVSAAAVLMSAIFAIMVASIIFIPKIWEFISAK